MRFTTALAGVVAGAWTQYGTASPIEVLWTISGLVGIYFTWHNLRDARKYIGALRALRTGSRPGRDVKIIAFGHYRNEILRLLIFLVVIAVGVIAMITPPTAHTSVRPSAVGLAITAGLFMITAILIAASALDRRQRDLLMTEDS